MNRRKFAQGVAAALALPAVLQTEAQHREQNRAASVRFSVMLCALAEHASVERCLTIVAEAGYSGVELTGEFHQWSTDETSRVLAQLKSLGLVIDAMSGVRAGFAVPDETAAFQSQFQEQLVFAERLQCPQIILLSGNRSAHQSPEMQRTTSIQNLRWAGNLAAKAGVEMVIEPIDLLESPQIYLSSVTDAFDIARAVAMPGVKVLYDVYHEQRSFGNLIEKFERNINLIGLVHIADVPGRHEPGSGEIAFTNVYHALAAGHYTRWIAMEYYPTGDPVASLRRARLMAEAALATAASAAQKG